MLDILLTAVVRVGLAAALVTGVLAAQGELANVLNAPAAIEAALNGAR